MDGYRVKNESLFLTGDGKRKLAEAIATVALMIVLTQITSLTKSALWTGAAWVIYALVSCLNEYRSERWFWVTIVVLALAHCTLILLLPSFDLPGGPALSYVVPIMFADGFAMFGVVKLVAARMSTMTRQPRD